MTYRVVWAESAAKEITKIHPAERRRIEDIVAALADNPRPVGAIQLKGGESGQMRVRVGNYRVVYTIDDGQLTIWIVKVAHRREVYDRLKRKGKRR